ncbi:MAG: tetratricopeptide repeat protein [Chthoniobacterales bacterium]
MQDGWTPKKLVLVSVGVAVLSSALTGGIMVWLLTGQKPPEPVFQPHTAVTPMVAPAETPPAGVLESANWLYDHQRWSEAIAAYEKALTAGFDNPDVRTDLGNCYRFSNRPEAALEQYQLAQKQGANHEHSLYNQASLYSEVMKNPAKADEVARQFIARFPGSESSVTIKKYLAAP